MEKILKSHQISSAIIDLLEDDESEQFFLVTPYFDPWKRLEDAFEKAARQNKEIIFILRADQENKLRKEVERLNRLFSFDFIFVKRLHAKIYMNANKAIISSMNLYDSSQTNNYEFGYVLNRKESDDVYRNIIEPDYLENDNWKIVKGKYFKAIDDRKSKKGVLSKAGSFIKKTFLEESEKANKQEEVKDNATNKIIKTEIDVVDNNKQKVSRIEHGYCIRCHKTIPYSIQRPLCYDCYKKWAVYENSDYKEKYCELCGEESNTSLSKPICLSCYKKNPLARS
jgi:RNA polymerase-binding transcription factor DksA